VRPPSTLENKYARAEPKPMPATTMPSRRRWLPLFSACWFGVSYLLSISCPYLVDFCFACDIAPLAGTRSSDESWHKNMHDPNGTAAKIAASVRFQSVPPGLIRLRQVVSHGKQKAEDRKQRAEGCTIASQNRLGGLPSDGERPSQRLSGP
jgi:hypothetical protein